VLTNLIVSQKLHLHYHYYYADPSNIMWRCHRPMSHDGTWSSQLLTYNTMSQ